MGSRMLYVSLPAAALGAALLIGTVPVAWAQCEMAASGSMVEDMTTTQPGAGASAETGTATEQSGTATADSGIETEQGGVTTGPTGKKTAQGAATEEGGTATAAVDSPDIEGPDEEQIQSLLKEQGYTEVSSIYSCGAYYEAEAMQDGQQKTVLVDLQTGRITTQKQQ